MSNLVDTNMSGRSTIGVMIIRDKIATHTVRVSPGLSSFSLSKPRSQIPSLPGIFAYCRV